MKTLSTDTVDVNVHYYARCLTQGLVVWGAGASVRREGDCYVVNHANEDGSDYAQTYSDPYDAFWRYMARVNGRAMITVSTL